MNTKIKPLAGLATYEEAEKLGLGVEENVRRLLRYAWIDKCAMEASLYWLAPTPEWEVKEAVGLHASLDEDHTADMRKRIGEMRSTVPSMESSPDQNINNLFNEVLASKTTLEKVVGLYGVIKPALLTAYKEHLAAVNSVFDHPIYRMLKHIVLDEEEIVAWRLHAVEALTQTEEAKSQAENWKDRLELFLAFAGGVEGNGKAFDDAILPEKST